MEAKIAALGSALDSLSKHIDRRLDDMVERFDQRFDDQAKRVDQRFDDNAEVQSDRHGENVDRLETIDGRVRETNGSVARHEEQIRTLFRRAPAAPAVPPRPAAPKDDEATPYTKRDAIMVAVGAGALIAAWKFVLYVGALVKAGAELPH